MATSPEAVAFLDLARPVLPRLDGYWSDENAVARGITLAESRIRGLEHIGYVERRRHWLTRRTQLRLTPVALTSMRVNAERGRGL